jgi:hypothetical protein
MAAVGLQSIANHELDGLSLPTTTAPEHNDGVSPESNTAATNGDGEPPRKKPKQRRNKVSLSCTSL